jgi:hypothetical protein
MGNCMSCGRSINLKEGEETCPNCGKNPYICWNCGREITGSEKECPVCHFYTCPGCGRCGKNCARPFLIIKCAGMSVEQIVDYVMLWKSGKMRGNCHKGVPLSYAKGKLKTFALKLQGFRVKSDDDLEAFEKKFEEIKEFPIGKTWTVNFIKDNGTYGQEYREASNLAVCMGLAVKEKAEKDGHEYYRYRRENREQCPYANWDKLVVKQCPKCKKTYSFLNSHLKRCMCTRKTRGKEKGFFWALENRTSNCDFCDLPRGQFFIEKEGDDGKVSGGVQQEGQGISAKE